MPIRKETEPTVRPVWDAVGPRVDALLAESAHWTGGKQQLTATRLHELLVADGHRVGFVPLTYRPGDLGEVDSFEVLVDLDGTRREAWLFLMRLMYAGRDFAWIDVRQDQISFSTGTSGRSRISTACQAGSRTTISARPSSGSSSGASTP